MGTVTTHIPPPEQEVRRFEPQDGPQTAFMSTDAEIAVYGGSAGGGKTFALLLDALYYAALEPVRGFGAVIFRRTSPQITQEGGLWDESGKVYPFAKGLSKQTRLEWVWPHHKTKIRFAHMQYESDRFNWQGSQIAYIAFDELTHFTEEQFFYLLSRNRSTCGVRPCMRGTCNPDADSWVKQFLAPWVDEHWPEEDRAASGEIRSFIREDGMVHWLKRGETHPDAKTVTFIAASIYDNPALLKANPEYLVNLKSLPLVERERLLSGNWAIRKEGGKVFKRGWFKVIEVAPADIVKWVRFWDFAATEDERREQKNAEKGGPDYTASCLIGKTARNSFVVLHATWDRMSPAQTDEFAKNIAAQDGTRVAQRMEQEPGASGKRDVAHFRRHVFFTSDFLGVPSQGDKLERSRIPSSHVEQGNVELVRGEWNEGFLNFLEAFPSTKVHDDVVDSFDGAMLCLIHDKRSVSDVMDWTRRYAALAGLAPKDACPTCGVELETGVVHTCQR